MTETTNTSDNGLFSDLPATYAGWQRVKSDDTLFEFWRRDSNHINGVYNQVRAQGTTDGEVILSKTSYDQFGHRLSGNRLTARPTGDCEWVWKMARRQMDQFTGNGDFDSKPSVPKQVGNWELAFEGLDADQNPATTWCCGAATVVVKEEVMEVHYSYTRRAQTLVYQEEGEEPHIIATGIPRTCAYEMAVAIMEALPAPVSRLHRRRRSLKDISGIGPAKAKQLLLLGISTPDELARAVKEDSEFPVNHHHRDALEKPLTSRIKQQLEEIRKAGQSEKGASTQPAISARSQSGSRSDAK